MRINVQTLSVAQQNYWIFSIFVRCLRFNIWLCLILLAFSHPYEYVLAMHHRYSTHTRMMHICAQSAQPTYSKLYYR